MMLQLQTISLRKVILKVKMINIENEIESYLLSNFNKITN